MILNELILEHALSECTICGDEIPVSQCPALSRDKEDR